MWQHPALYRDDGKIDVYKRLATIDMSTSDNFRQQILVNQSTTFMKANSKICIPINWNLILAKTTPKWTPRSVRSYLSTVCEKINAHFAIVMSGPKIGSIEVTRLNRESAQPPIKVILSTWRCQQLFPKKVSIAWMENETRKQIHMSAFSLWLKSSNRREVQPEVSVPIQPPSVVANWLRHILSLSNTDACPLEFNALNTRKNVYQSWYEVVGERKCEWSPKRISEALYRTFPRSRPIKGRREKLRGIAVIEIPSKSEFYDALEAFNVQPLRL